MKHLLATTAMLALLPLALQAKPDINNPADVAAITALENQLATDLDMKTLIYMYAPNAIADDIMAPGTYHGLAQIYAGYERQLAPVKTMHHTIPDLNITSDGTLACAAMQLHFDFALKNGSNASVSLRQIDAFRKINGNWRIIQEHISYPTDAKTGMTLYDAPIQPAGPVNLGPDPFPGPAISPAQAKAEIHAWMVKGAVSRGIDELLSYYGPDDALIYDTYAPGVLHGLPAIRAYYAPLMGSYDSIIVKMPQFFADSDGLFGVQLDTQDMKLTMKDGSTRYISLRQSDCMHRVGGKWYSFYEMISYPTDEATGKAITANPAAFAK